MSNKSVIIDEFNIILQSQNNVSGDFEVIVTASDGMENGQTSNEFALTIIPVNDPLDFKFEI